MKRNSLALALVLASSAAIAGWTDTGATQPPRGTSASTQPTLPARAAVTPAAGSVSTHSQLSPSSSARVSATPYAGRTASQMAPANPARTPERNGWAYDDPPAALRNDYTISPDLYSAFLDVREPSDIWYRATLATKGDVEGMNDEFGFVELAAAWRMAEFLNVAYGDITITLRPSLRILTGDAGINAMPSAPMAIPVDVEWIWRYLNGWSLEVGAAPGIYADVKGLFQASAISLPFRGVMYYNFSDELAVRFGAIIRPNWDTVLMPVVGVAWKPSEMFRLEAGIPETLVEARLASLTLYGRIDWLNTTYALDDGDGKPERVTFNDWRIGAGAAIEFTETIQLAFEVGLLAGRDVSFDGGASDVELDVDSVPYFSVLFGSEF